MLTSNGLSTLSPPHVHRTRRGFSFSGRKAETTRKYVALRPRGMSDTRMKNIVLVPYMVP